MSKQQRWCPAIEKEIGPAECGQNRASRYNCPVECPFNPWSPANYERALEIEGNLEGKMFSILKTETSRDSEFQRDLALLYDSKLLTRQQFFVDALHRKQDANGQTFVQRLLEKGKDRLSNDERVLLEHTTQMRPVLLEVHRVLNDTQCEVVDLIETVREPFFIQDRSLAANAVRFMQLLGWSFSMPHYRRIHGVAFPLPEVAQFDADEVLRVIVAHLGGPVAPVEALRDWLARNMIQVSESCEHTAGAQRRRMWQQMDAKICESTYTIRGDHKTLLRRFAECDDFAEGDLPEAEKSKGWWEAFDCFDEAAPLEPGQTGLQLEGPGTRTLGRPLLGRIIVGGDQVRLETTASARLQALKSRFEKRASDLVEFVSERVEDLAGQHASRTPSADLSLVPPVFLENPPRLLVSSTRLDRELPAGLSPDEASASLMRSYARQWLDIAVPALGGKTPREAAGIPALRATLIRLIKPIIRQHDQRVLETGHPEEINWLTTELGLHEVTFPSPPPREPVMKQDDDFLDDCLPEDDEIFYDLPPPLPGRPLRESEILERMKASDEELPDPEDALDGLMEVAPDLFDAIDELTEDVERWAAILLITTLARAWFTFFPPGTAPVSFDIDNFLAEAADETQKFLDEMKRGPNALEASLTTGPQPTLLMMLAAPLLATGLSSKRRKDRELRVQPHEMPLLIGTLRAFIVQADRAAR